MADMPRWEEMSVAEQRVATERAEKTERYRRELERMRMEPAQSVNMEDLPATAGAPTREYTEYRAGAATLNSLVRRIAVGAVLAALAGVVVQRVVTTAVIRRLASPDNTVFGRLAVATMEKFNNPGILDAIARLDLKEGETLLEICSGAGYAVEEALQHKGVQVMAVDLSPEMVRLASERNRAGIAAGRAEVRLASVQDLGWLPSNSVDKILHFNCVYFWQDLAGALAELLRVLKPHGLMLAGTKFGEIQKHFAGGERPLDAGFININETEFVQAMVAAGFTNVHERKVRLASSCTGKNAKSGCPVDPKMHYDAVFARKG